MADYLSRRGLMGNHEDRELQKEQSELNSHKTHSQAVLFYTYHRYLMKIIKEYYFVMRWYLIAMI